MQLNKIKKAVPQLYTLGNLPLPPKQEAIPPPRIKTSRKQIFVLVLDLFGVFS